MRVIRPRGDDPEELWPGTDYQHTLGDSRSNTLDGTPTAAEVKEYRKQLRERIARKRPIGFQARWDD